MTLNTKDLYQASVGVGTTSPYQTIPAVALVDEFGKHISEFSISAGIVTVTSIINDVEIKNDSGNPIPTVTGLEIPKHNRINITYSGSNIVGVAYSMNNVGVATLTLSYDGSNNLISVVRT